MNTQLNYHHLRYFLAVADHGGVKAASQILHVSPPTLSAQVRELEDMLGTALFRREGRRLVPTEAGRLARTYAARIFALGDEMLEALQRGGTRGVESVFVGIADTVPKLVVARLLGRAWKTMPGLRIVVREGQAPELFAALSARQLDLAVTTEPASPSRRPPLTSRVAARFGIQLVATPLLKRRFARTRKLEGFPLLVPARESPLRRELERWWSETGVHPEIRAEFDDAAAMYELAAGGVGAAPVPGALVKHIASRYGLSVLPVEPPIHEELFVVTTAAGPGGAGSRLVAELAASVSDDA